MLKGNNELRFCTATIIDAVQRYLDEELTHRVKVTAVTELRDGSQSGFKVLVSEAEPDKGPSGEDF